MDIFKFTSPFYDILYSSKQYQEEVDHINHLASTLGFNKPTVLDLGCGTGEHARLFAQKGLDVTGIDSSSNMLKIANKKIGKLNKYLHFVEDDARTLRMDKKFDIVISLFHVTSYMLTQNDIQGFLRTIEAHMKNTGIGLFDCWYGPGVLLDRPEIRSNHYETSDFFIHRIKEPLMSPHNNRVEIKHLLYLENKKTHQIKHIKETHLLRYYFYPEIELLLKQAGLKIMRWGTLKSNLTEPPPENGWEAYFLIQKINSEEQ